MACGIVKQDKGFSVLGGLGFSGDFWFAIFRIGVQFFSELSCKCFQGFVFRYDGEEDSVLDFFVSYNNSGNGVKGLY